MTDKAVKKTREEVLHEIDLAHQKRHASAEMLLAAIKSNRLEITQKLEHFRRQEPDLVYRFYHQSYKVFILNDLTRHAVELFNRLSPESLPLNSWFQGIIDEALGKEFDWETTNPKWLAETLPVLQAFWHSKYFLEQMIVAADEIDIAPQILPSGWAAVLYLYDLR
jgi:hypothetical protein